MRKEKACEGGLVLVIDHASVCNEVVAEHVLHETGRRADDVGLLADGKAVVDRLWLGTRAG